MDFRRHIKRYIAAGLTFLVLLTAACQMVSAASDDMALKKGMKGTAVTILQNNLKQLDYFNQEATGYFGSVTETAVRRFQKDNGLTSDGRVGDSTYDKLYSLLNASRNRPSLKKGMNGAYVTALQKDLARLGFFSQSPTGYFGAVTEAAVVKFQKKYALNADGVAGAGTYKKIDSLLKRKDPLKVVIDPGHGGIDVGTSKGGVVESEVTLSISRKLKAYLNQYGYDALLTRSTDKALDSLSKNGATRQERDLNARTNIINQSGAELFVSIHVNSSPDSPSTTGSVVYYNSKVSGSKALAQNIQKALNGISAAGLKRQAHSSETADYYVLRNSSVPGVLVETAFITNTAERRLLSTGDFRDRLAKAILTGIENTKLG